MRRWGVNQIAFRVDGGVRLGMGHIYKTLALAKKMRDEGLNPLCFLKEDAFGRKLLTQGGLRVISFPKGLPRSQEPLFMKRGLKGPSLFVTDILDTTEEYIMALKSGDHRVISLEDRGTGSRRTDATVNAVVDGLGHQVRRRNGHTHYQGSPYRVLHPGMVRAGKKVRIDVQDVMVFLGGGDDAGATLRIIRTLAPLYPQLQWHVVVGVARGDKKSLTKKLTAVSPRLRVYEGLEHLGGVLSRCDLAILAGGGGSLYEASYAGVPALALAKVPHQRKNIEAFASLGSVVDCGWAQSFGTKRLQKEFRRCIQSVLLRKKMSTAGRRCVDGKGLERVLGILERVSRA